MTPTLPAARLTVVECVYYQGPLGEDPLAAEARFGRRVGSGDLPDRRRLSVSGDWQRLPPGGGMLCLANDEGRGLQVVPTDEERDAVACRVVEVGVGAAAGVTPFARVRPGESLRFEPAGSPGLHARCLGGTARCTLTIFPG